MFNRIIIAGSGGQGIQFAGQTLARAAVGQNLTATYVPTYGAERRGGPSFCFVVVADQEIYTPVFQYADSLIALDQRARNTYGATVREGGIILANSDLAGKPAPGEIAKVTEIAASSLAGKEPLNLVMMGAFLSLAPEIKVESVRDIINARFAKRPEQLQANLIALQKGMESVGRK